MNPRIEEACKIPNISVRLQNFYEHVGKTMLSYAFCGGSFCSVCVYICMYVYTYIYIMCKFLDPETVSRNLSSVINQSNSSKFKYIRMLNSTLYTRDVLKAALKSSSICNRQNTLVYNHRSIVAFMELLK